MSAKGEARAQGADDGLTHAEGWARYDRRRRRRLGARSPLVLGGERNVETEAESSETLVVAGGFGEGEARLALGDIDKWRTPDRSARSAEWIVVCPIVGSDR